MMTVETLTLHSIIEAGVPHKERIAIQANGPTDLTYFGLLIGVTTQGDNAVPLRDNLMWLGNGQLDEGDWLFVYTGPGAKRTDMLDDGKKLISIFWERKQTVFYDSKIVPVLVHFSSLAILLPPVPKPLPQYPPLGAAKNKLLT